MCSSLAMPWAALSSGRRQQRRGGTCVLRVRSSAPAMFNARWGSHDAVAELLLERGAKDVLPAELLPYDPITVHSPPYED